LLVKTPKMIKLRKYLPLLIIISLLGCASSPERKSASKECRDSGHTGFSAYTKCMDRWEASQKVESFKLRCQMYGFKFGNELAQCIQRETHLEKAKLEYQTKLSNAAVSSAICSAFAKDSASCVAGSLEGASGASLQSDKNQIERMEKEIKKLRREQEDMERKRFLENLNKPSNRY
jgi:hypothetical protein